MKLWFHLLQIILAFLFCTLLTLVPCLMAGEILMMKVTLCHNVRDTWPALEMPNSKCPNLKYLKLGQFHGICKGIDARPDVIAICSKLESSSIKKSADLSDASLTAISFGCLRLSKFEVHGCKKITEIGMNKLASILRKTLIDGKISCCKHLNTVCSLRALEPIRERVQRFHIDCLWENVEKFGGGASSSGQSNELKHFTVSEKRGFNWEETATSSRKKSKKHNSKEMKMIGELLIPLALPGLENCPGLEEIKIKVEGDCRYLSKPSTDSFGLSSLACYPRLSKMSLDCGAAIGFALTAPLGLGDLSPWERFYLKGIGSLNLTEVDNWPPQDTDVNQRSLTLPAAGLLAQCRSLRKLFIHGTANEHFMMFLLKVPTLRDVQLRRRIPD
ncbi:ubiquitin-protein ligase, putative [Ricinus communis]|uniref:Ubiquitin-protein ligase, putative n=1 Tax=Ricinus communis TaxID=3988 RepID=B9T843_RICCO|nr:ubiquitin-protein ligase, putative [Ricinus communis]